MGFDLDEALERVGGDRELLKEIADLFLEDAPRSLEAVRLAIDANDCPALQRAAHSLKGSVANFGAQETVDAAFRLEKMGVDGKMGDAMATFAQLESALQTVCEGLSQIE